MRPEKTCPDVNQKQVSNVLPNDSSSTENDFECGIAEFKKPDTLLIPDGEYELMLDYYETAFMFQKKAVKLVMHFKILSHGTYFGKKICRFYNVKRVIGKPSKGGNFEPSARSDFIYELMTVFHWQPTGRRRDRIPMSIFKGQTIIGKVETVKRDSLGRDMPKQLGYSVVRKLLRLADQPCPIP